MENRVKGFDLARAYAIFGMFIVNFTFCFGTFTPDPGTEAPWFASLFVGNSTSIFIICAGMGLVFLKQKTELPQKLKSIVLKRSWFLFALGLLLYNWWPGDILHFYGGYLHIAAFLLFLPRKYYIWIAFFAIGFYYLLQLYIPLFESIDTSSTKYLDFWTPIGFLRNTFYNGWNSIFPWFAYFSIGMYLGHLNWNDANIRKKIFIFGALLLIVFKSLRFFVKYDFNSSRNWFYDKYWIHIMNDYFPANIPYLMITTGFALMVITICVHLGEYFSNSKLVNILSKAGQMTLSFYVFHITVGMLLLSFISHKAYDGLLNKDNPLPIENILAYSILFFIGTILLSMLWSKKFRNGPLETIMRKISN